MRPRLTPGFGVVRRRQRGSTSPPLANIHPNPGPYKIGRKRATSIKDTKRSKKHKSDIEKGKIEAYLDVGMSQVATAKTVDCHRNTVGNLARKLRETGEMKNRRKSGRPHITSEREDR